MRECWYVRGKGRGVTFCATCKNFPCAFMRGGASSLKELGCFLCYYFLVVFGRTLGHFVVDDIEDKQSIALYCCFTCIFVCS